MNGRGRTIRPLKNLSFINEPPRGKERNLLHELANERKDHKKGSGSGAEEHRTVALPSD